MDAERVYQASAEKSDILNGYIVPEYDVLHTQSREYIVNDIIEVMKERGVEICGGLPEGVSGTSVLS